jgi:hypothetical protein
MKLIALGLVAAALLGQPSPTITDPDAYAVYSALIPTDSFVRDAPERTPDPGLDGSR